MAQHRVEWVAVTDGTERSNRFGEPAAPGAVRGDGAGWHQTERPGRGERGAGTAGRRRHVVQERVAMRRGAGMARWVGQDAAHRHLPPAAIATCGHRITLGAQRMLTTTSAHGRPFRRPGRRRGRVDVVLPAPAIRPLSACLRAVQAGPASAVDELDHPVATGTVPAIDDGADRQERGDAAATRERRQDGRGGVARHVVDHERRVLQRRRADRGNERGAEHQAAAGALVAGDLGASTVVGESSRPPHPSNGAIHESSQPCWRGSGHAPRP